jgi:hypothetical protein
MIVGLNSRTSPALRDQSALIKVGRACWRAMPFSYSVQASVFFVPRWQKFVFDLPHPWLKNKFAKRTHFEKSEAIMNKSNTKTPRHFGAKNEPKFRGGAKAATGRPFKTFQGVSKQFKAFQRFWRKKSDLASPVWLDSVPCGWSRPIYSPAQSNLAQPNQVKSNSLRK